jgi:hypothetical protein
MAFHELVQDLRETEQRLIRELAGVQKAISSLELDSSPATRKPGRPAGAKNKKRIIIVGGRPTTDTAIPPVIVRRGGASVPSKIRATEASETAKAPKRRPLSAKGRAAIVRAQKARWAKLRAAKK